MHHTGPIYLGITLARILPFLDPSQLYVCCHGSTDGVPTWQVMLLYAQSTNLLHSNIIIYFIAFKIKILLNQIKSMEYDYLKESGTEETDPLQNDSRTSSSYQPNFPSIPGKSIPIPTKYRSIMQI